MRNSSRRSETAFMRVSSWSLCIYGMPSVMIFATDAMAANIVTRKSRSRSSRQKPRLILFIGRSIFEADHLLHHQNPDSHPHRATHQHEVAELDGEHGLDICGRAD